MFKLGRRRIKSPQAVLRGIQRYLTLFIRAGALLGALSGPAHGQDLPVPCGGGACIANGGPSVWVTSGDVQAPTVAANTMNINQLSDKAILNWSSFNIGAGAKVDFNQPGASSVALNRIFQGNASQILGALHANGQVYLINQNGFLFGKTATVDVHGLTVSTLDVDDNLFKSSGIAQAINQSTPTAAFQGSGKMGDINIARGAVIKTDDGGQVMIFAPNITNNGEIDTPKGQTILAASRDKVYLKINSPNDPGLRGFLVEVNNGGTVTNAGKISVGEGNATLEGLTVNQDGLVSATTSVQLNGSIRLLARDQVNNSFLSTYSQGTQSQITTHTGTVNFGPGSVTQVLPDVADTSTTVDDQAQPLSTVDVMGKTIDLKGNSKIVVPGGQVNLTATVSPQNVGAQATMPPNDSRLLMEAKSLIDVSGTTNTVLPMSRNTVQLQLRGNELANSPLQRNGVLYGQTVTVDVRKGTPLANVSGAIQGIQRTVSERLSGGGTVNATSEGDVVVAKGAEVNFSGGQVTYQGGNLNTTQLYAQNGTVVDIGNADPNQTYTAALGSYQENHPAWGVSKTYLLPGVNTGSTYTPGYVQGMDAGTFSVRAHGVVLDGQLKGNSAAGALQRLAPAVLATNTPVWDRPYDQLPLGGRLIIGYASQASQSQPQFGTPDVVFTPRVTPVSNFDASFVNKPVNLSTDLFSSGGISRAAIYSNGTITVPRGVTLAMAPGGTLSLTAGTSSVPADPTAPIPPSLEVDGSISIPGGSVNLTSDITCTICPSATDQPRYQSVVIGNGSRVDVAGMWVNDSNTLNPGGASGPAVIDGGSVTVTNTSGGDVTLSQGSIIDVGGGARVLADGTVTAGSGGNVSLTSNSGKYATALTLDGTLQGDALFQGGTLAITADGIQIQALSSNDQSSKGMLLLDPAMFQNDGFGSYDLTSTKLGLSVAGGAAVNLAQQNRALDSGYQNQPTGADMSQFSHLQRLPLPQRQAINLSLTSKREGNGFDQNAGLTVGRGAVIQADPRALIGLSSDRMVTIAGTIDAPAGTIDVTLQQGLESEGFYPDKAIWLTPGGRLEAPAYVMLVPNDLGLNEGQVLDAGTIGLQAQEGQIVAASGSTMDVSGTSQTLSILSDTGDRSAYVRTDVAGSAGSIQLTAADGMYLDGTMDAKAADAAGAAGGRLSVTLDSSARFGGKVIPANSYYAPKGPRTIELTADTTTVLPAGVKPGDVLLSQAQLDQLHTTDLNTVSSVAHVSATRIQQGGFDSVNFTARPVMKTNTTVQPLSSAQIQFDGNVNLNVRQSITFDTPVLRSQNGQVTLNAAYVAMGSTDSEARLTGAPSAGSGTLGINANFIDLVGDTALQGFGSAAAPAITMDATQDIRLQGVRIAGARAVAGGLQAAGDIQLQAGQIYPSTLTQFTLGVVGDPHGTITVTGTGVTTSAPLSAGGVLTMSAPNIIQDGTLRAPFGGIQLDAGQSLQLKAGSDTSVSGAGLIVPFGQTQFGRDWIIPYQQVPGETASLLSVISQQQGQPYDMALPDKQVTLNAPSVSFDKGATIDLSGGGDLYAYEFVPGPGGSQDILLPANDNGAFAVVPSLHSLYAPVDPVISSQGLQPGNTIYLSGGNGLAAGEYAMLPARYALLPGAFLVTPVAGTAGMNPGQSYPQLSGIPVIAGQQGVAGTDVRASLWSGYAIENGAQVRQRAQYTESYANTFFATDANGAPTNIPLPQDAGAVTIAAQQDLTLGGHMNGQAPNGRGAQLDIVAQQLDVVAKPGDSAAGVQILASDLNGLGADSVLLGGQRQVTSDGVTVQAQARSVQIDGGVTLTLPELILVAVSGQDGNGNTQPGQVTVASGVTLNGSGAASATGGTLILNGDSAMLRIAAGSQPTLQRTNLPSSPTAQLTVASGAQLIAGNTDAAGKLQGGSLILDSAGNTRSSGDIQVGNGGSLRLGASRISLGDVANLSGNQGLLLSNAALSRLDVANMSLISASGIDIYGAAAITSNNMTLQARSIDGYANGGQAATLQADILTLVGAAQSQSPGGGTGTGILNLQAQQLNLGGGGAPNAGVSKSLAISGFDQVNVSAGTVNLQGTGQLQITGATDITAGQFSGAAASDWTVSTPDPLAVLGSSKTPATSAAPALGGSLALEGSQVSFDSNVVMPDGRLILSATGSGVGDGVVIGPHAAVDVAGRVVDFAGTSVASPGGQVLLASANGDVQIQSGAKVDVAGGNDTAGAGGITIQAPNGTAAIAGDLVATQTLGGDGQGGFSLDAGSIGDFAALAGTLKRGGFTGTVAIRARTGDLSLAAGDILRAHDLTLTADSGNIDISGVIDASGTQAGRVSIDAGNDLTVSATGDIDAHATGAGAKGGSVLLGTSQGALTFAQGAMIDVTGTQTADVQIQQGGQTVTRTGTGLVQFRVPRASLAGSDLSGAVDGIKGAGSTVVEAYRVYDISGGTLGSSAVVPGSSNSYYQDAVTFMQNEASLMAGLGLANDAAAQLRPGVEFDAAGSLNLAAPMDLSQWRFGSQNAPGVLTLRASGNLDIAGNLSDGFTSGTDFVGNPMDVLRNDDSWSLRLVAGADLSSADPLAVDAGGGNLTIGNNVTVRTGTGSIDVAAGGNLVLSNNESVVYTAGVDGGPGTYDPLYAAYFLNGQFPVGGGDLRIAVNRDIVAQPSQQLINAWLPRLGGSSVLGDLPTTWAINFGNFHQGVGALGGGNVTVSAGGNISDLSVVMPTIGTQVGQAQYDENAGTANVITNQVAVTGGTQLSVSAAGDIRGGVFYAGQGRGNVRAGGTIGTSQQTAFDPILAVGDAQVNMTAGGDLGLETVINPTVLPQSVSQSLGGASTLLSYFFTYGPDSAVNLTSLSGNISFSNDTNLLAKTFNVSTNMWTVYPGTLSATALQGDINIGQNNFMLFPSAQGQLELLAAGSVLASDNQTPQINVSDADPGALPSVSQPVNDVGAQSIVAQSLNPRASAQYSHAPVPVHAGDTTPVLIVARDGSIGANPASSGYLTLFLPKPFQLVAGQDVRNAAVIGQNLTATDISLIQAGRDVVFSSQRSGTGALSGNNLVEYRIGGPGQLDIIAGRNVDLGTSAGVTTIGNTQNPVLAATGASVLVMAGVSQAPDYTSFIQRYLVDSDQYQPELAQLLDRYPSSDSTLGDIDRFKALPLNVQRQFILQVFFSELKASGIAAASSQIKDYARGFDVIDTLFPGSVGNSSSGTGGNLNMLLSRIATLDGGNITLVVPHGLINAGTADTSAISKDTSQLGIVVQGNGNIDSYVRGNFNVNQSRVFTLDGGDILIWSSLGDIDAGRGAKTAIAAPPPIVTVDPKTGGVSLVFPPAIAGSGIRAAVTTPGKSPGNVYLFAPKGVVNAGDAGIASEGNLTIGASHVLGASNITVGGVSVGVPTAPVSIAAGLTGLNSISSSVAKSAANSVNSMTSNAVSNTPLADAALSYLKVVVISLGDTPVGN